jgi:hypothetical protein
VNYFFTLTVFRLLEEPIFHFRKNHRRFVRGKRAGLAPIEILTGKEMEKA